MLPTLDARLTAAAQLVRPGQPVADIGCDHGKLTAVLAAMPILASSMRKLPLSMRLGLLFGYVVGGFHF